ncbi:hypothetical protein ACUXZZ_45215 (plasmid) [Streptomyces graminifolii]|uniref:hypothetical protein n=1 Tax=Streptomyces graminifolii TaxID=1266771 RepID=UPI0040599795
MTSDRHLALMALINEIEAPAKTYRHAVRRASNEATDSAEWNATVAIGNAALDDIERAVRLWVDTNLPQPIPGLCGIPSPDGRFVCALEPHTVEEMHSDRPVKDAMPNGRRMVWETPAELPDGFTRHTCVTVKCAVCGYGYDETEYDHHFPGLGDALDGVVGSGWDELKDGRVLCETQDEKHNELRQTVGVVDPDDEGVTP